MAKSKFTDIYKDLKEKIESGLYPYQSMLPSENNLVEVYDCSRNTVRRAIGMLAEDGYVQSMHGKGVRIIYQPAPSTAFSIGGIESFKESAARNHKTTSTKVVQFGEINCDERVAKKTGFAVGETLYYVRRVRYFDNKALILDTNYFSKALVPDLTPEIAENSIYDYIEHTLGMQIVTSRRIMTVEFATPADEAYLDLDDYNCIAVVTGQTFNDNGILFEFTQSRHRPDCFSFSSVATRKSE